MIIKATIRHGRAAPASWHWRCLGAARREHLLVVQRRRLHGQFNLEGLRYPEGGGPEMQALRVFKARVEVNIGSQSKIHVNAVYEASKSISRQFW